MARHQLEAELSGHRLDVGDGGDGAAGRAVFVGDPQPAEAEGLVEDADLAVIALGVDMGPDMIAAGLLAAPTMPAATALVVENTSVGTVWRSSASFRRGMVPMTIIRSMSPPLSSRCRIGSADA
ncbi:hypothetical protein [Azospirillum sp. B506]|uniref:hypothetical protein n=1 Tax=Azospirillum sp. B506 TaxID=137721 RepID=UPI000678F3C9|nr:hypothetical protein [Azospirillum sp. B506]